MSHDPRDQLWQGVFETYYDAYYEEIFATAMIARWQVVDEIAKVLVALSASGSAVSGWALWNQPGWRTLWTVFAAVGAVLTILHATLGVAGRLKDWGDTQRAFACLRIDLATLRYRMSIDANFPIDPYTEEFVALRKRYAEAVDREKNDILGTNGLALHCQDLLDARISNEIVVEEG